MVMASRPDVATASVPVTVVDSVVLAQHEVDALFHVFPILMPWADASRQISREVAAFVAGRLAEAPPLHPETIDGIRT